MPVMRRWLVSMVAAVGGDVRDHGLASAGGGARAMHRSAGSATCCSVDYMGIVADVAVTSVDLSDIPPGFGRAPLGPRYEVYRANVTVHVIKAPNPYITSIVFDFNGVTPIADAYKPRNSDSPDDLRTALQNAPAGATVTGGVWWDVYRDLVTNVVLLDKVTGYSPRPVEPQLSRHAHRGDPGRRGRPTRTRRRGRTHLSPGLSPVGDARRRRRVHRREPDGGPLPASTSPTDDRVVLIARDGTRMSGYAMLIRGVVDDDDVQRAVPLRPAVELSKMYVLPDGHGAGVSAALMTAALAAARDLDAACVWLGVNQENQRAQRFYAKHGFTVGGIKTFRLGEHIENDYVMVRPLRR